VTRARFPGRATIPLGSNLVVYSHCLPSFSLEETGVQKGSFRRISGYGLAPNDFVFDKKTDEITKTGRRDENIDF